MPSPDSALPDLYDAGFQLLRERKHREAVAEFERLERQAKDVRKICPLMIGMIHYYELEDHQAALPWARTAVTQRPRSEAASLCLVHCLWHIGDHSQIHEEIKRYLATGKPLDLYKALFDENNLTPEAFK